jgi:hypothetical protein
VNAPAWEPPESCDQCPRPISEHTIWEPELAEAGWMHCRAPGCKDCWHDWPRLGGKSGPTLGP